MATASADQPLKGLAVLLKAFAALLPAHPDLRLLVVGKPRPGGDSEKLIARLDLGAHIDFVSGISTAELGRLYASSTLVVVPSLYEGFGLPPSEAMACGAPVVSSDGGALPEVVGDAGVLVPAGDETALAGAIAPLLADPARRAELGSVHGQRDDRTIFCWRRAPRQMTSIGWPAAGRRWPPSTSPPTCRPGDRVLDVGLRRGPPCPHGVAQRQVYAVGIDLNAQDVAPTAGPGFATRWPRAGPVHRALQPGFRRGQRTASAVRRLLLRTRDLLRGARAHRPTTATCSPRSAGC